MRACRAGNRKGACACSLMRFPTSGFGRRSESHTRAMEASGTSLRKAAITRIFAGCIAAVVACCSLVSGEEQGLAQCKLAADGPGGCKFHRNYVGKDSRSAPKEHQADSAFLITCTEAKGYKSADPLDGTGGAQRKMLDQGCQWRFTVDASGRWPILFQALMMVQGVRDSR